VPNVAVQNFTITNGNGNASFLQTGNTSYVLKPLLEQLGDAFIFFSAYDPAYVANLLLSYAPNSEVMPAPVIASGVYLLNADNCSLIDNIISNCTHGNSLINNKYSFGFTSVGYAQTVKDIDNSNIIDGKPICYWINKTGLTVPPDAGYVALINCTNITVENLHLSNNYNNLLIANSHNCKIRNNTLTDNYIGITLIDSVDNVFQDNNIYGNVLNFGNAQFSQNIDTSNLVEGKPVYVWVNEHDKEVPTDAGLVALINCSRITVQNLNLSNNAVGIVLENSNNCTITNNSLTGVNEAIKLTASYDVTISNNTITTSANGITVEADSINNRVLGNSVADSGDSGIKIYASTNNLVYGNHINDCTSGVQINNASYNKVQRNVLTNNTYGISLSCISDGIHLSDSSTFNVIYENNLTDNENGIGILAYEVTNNTVYHNNFKDNTNQAYATAYNTQVRNIWDNGSEGNYWSNYNGTDTNNDGIGDEPLIIFQYQIIIVQEGYDQDHYPLMQPYTKP
jgi:parallel beta-helix repeat protein